MMTVLPTPAPPKVPILPPRMNGDDQVDDLDARHQHFGLGGLLLDARRLTVNRASAARLPGAGMLSTGWPSTLKMRPSVSGPTGTAMALPVS